jgi:hypothetical protein
VRFVVARSFRGAFHHVRDFRQGKPMHFGKLSLALTLALLFGSTSLARAQDHDPGIVPQSAGGSPVPVVEQTHLTFTVRNAGLDGGSTVFDINRATGAYTVEENGGMAHFIELKSMGKLSPAQMKSIEKALSTAEAAKLPAQMPSALVAGAPEFTIAWATEGGPGGSISGPNNPSAATEGQPASVKKLWSALDPLLSKVSKLEASLVKNHPYTPDIRTVEDPAEAAKPEAEKAPKTVDLGHLDSPGKQFITAANKAGLVQAGELVLKPGQKISFETDRNQINGIADMKSTNPDVTITSKVVKAMNPGQLGDEQTVEWTIALSPNAKVGNTGQITATSDYQSRNDPAYNFSVGIERQAASPEAPVAKPENASDDGVTDAIRNRGKVGNSEAPRTGMDRLIDDELDEGKHPERAAEDGR